LRGAMGDEERREIDGRVFPSVLPSWACMCFVLAGRGKGRYGVCGFDGGRWIRFVALLCIASLLLFWIAVWYCRVIMMDGVGVVGW
jgi:hypothetical protein